LERRLKELRESNLLAEGIRRELLVKEEGQVSRGRE